MKLDPAKLFAELVIAVRAALQGRIENSAELIHYAIKHGLVQ